MTLRSNVAEDQIAAWADEVGWPLQSPAWREAIGAEFGKPYMVALRARLRQSARAGARITPPLDRVMLPLELTDPSDIRAVILAQDPYPREGRATGLAFAIAPGDEIPQSLANVFEELLPKAPPSPDLVAWATQGVLLINTIWTTEATKRLEHKEWGWETFTSVVLKRVRDLSPPSAILLWGDSAREYAPIFTGSRHKVFEASHPARTSRKISFIGSRPFERANEFLVGPPDRRINWSMRHKLDADPSPP